MLPGWILAKLRGGAGHFWRIFIIFHLKIITINILGVQSEVAFVNVLKLLKR
jgi:hypothetical protein